MATLSSLSNPLDSLNAARASGASDTFVDKSSLKTSEDTDKVAKKFEALLIHNMLKAMRSTTLGEKPSNERAMYDDMFDQELSKKLSEAGGLGIAAAISRQLNAQHGIEDKQTNSQFSAIEKNMQALSNNPRTLARNGNMASAVANLGQYQALLNATGSTNQLDKLNSASAAVDTNNISHSVEAISQHSFGDTKKNFIETLMPDAKRSAARLGVQPDIVIAIAALETGWGQHVVKTASGVSSHNLFGIKAHGATTPHTMHKTTEFVDNKPITVDEPFRRYEDRTSSVNDFADFLLSNPRYENALNASADNHNFLRELQRAGYATDPEYANKAINVLKQIETIRQSTAL